MADVVSYLEQQIEERHAKGWYDYWIASSCLLNRTRSVPVETYGIGYGSYRQPPDVQSGMSPILVRPDFADLDLPDIIQSMTIDDILSAHMPGGDIVPLFGEGFDWDAWGSYQDHADAAQKLGGIYITIHDGDDECDYIRIGGGAVNRYGAAVLTKQSGELLEEWMNEKEFNIPSRGVVEGGGQRGAGLGQLLGISTGQFTVWSEEWCRDRYCEDCDEAGFEPYTSREDRSKIFCYSCNKNIDDG